MAAELPRPGVEVIQVFQSVSPTIITPTLVPCVVGVCKQVVNVLTTTSSGGQQINSQALVTLPGFFVASVAIGVPPVYAGLNGLSLVLSIDNGPNVTVVFSDPLATGLSPATVVTQILAAFTTAGVTAATAETVGTNAFRVKTVGVGEFETLHIMSSTSPAVLTAFGLGADKVYTGLSVYSQHTVTVPQTNFPDPRNNLTQLGIQDETIRVFLSLGSGASLKELLRTESFLRNGGVPTIAALVGTVDLSGLTYATASVTTGTTDVTAGALYGGGGTLNALTLTLNVNGAGATTLTFSGTGNAASEAALLAAIHVQWPAITATVGGSGGTKLILTNSALGTGSTIVVTAGAGATALGISGTATGSAGVLDGASATFSLNGGSNVTATFTPPVANEAALLVALNAVFLTAATATGGVSQHLTITSAISGGNSSVKAVSDTLGAFATLGLTSGQTVVGISGVAAVDDGNGDSLTPLVQMTGENFTTSASAAVLTGTTDITAGGLYGGGGTLNGKSLTLSDGRVPQTITFSGTGNSANQAALLVALNGFFGSAASGRLSFVLGGSGTTKLVITNTAIGVESHIEVDGVGVSASGDAAVLLGLIAVTTAYPVIARGGPFPPAAGDQLYVDGVLLGTITAVAPGGVTNILKINKQIPINASLGVHYYILAENLTGVATATRPTADLVVTLDGTPVLKHEVLRDTTGAPITSKASIYIQYTAVRRDVTALAKKPGLLSFSDTSTLTTSLAPVDASNPLALGLYLALLNGPGIQVTGLGVDSIAADSPLGTVEAFTNAATFLEGFEVYAIAPLTHDETVAQVFNTHVNFMSEPESKGERIVLFNPSAPIAKLDTVVGSGLVGQTSGNGGLSFDTGISNLAALLLNAGINPIGTIDTTEGLFLDIAADALSYSIQSIAGSIVTIRTSFASGTNDDGFYSTTALNFPPLPSILIDEPFSIKIRGASLTNVDGTPDKDGMAATYQGLGQSFLNRRFWQIVPDSCSATLGGLEQVIDGFYLCAATAGMIGQQPPQQSFTNFPMTGFTQVSGSNNFFSDRQLNVIAAGGNYIIVQDTPGAPLIARMALTTDLTSIETRTDSVNKVVDFSAKFLRKGLKNFIGRFNITQGFLDSLGHVIQGLLDFLIQTGVLIGAHLNNLVQDTDAPDTVLVDITLDVPFPCNYIRLTLVI